MADPPPHLTTYSPHACHPCKQSKRRCDRSFPSCTLCDQRGITCNYPHRRKERERRKRVADSDIYSSAGLGESEERDKGGSHDLFQWSTSELLAVQFLAPDMFHQMRLDVPKITVSISRAVADMVGSISDMQATAKAHFDSVHTWMPIVSKRRFSENLVNWLSHRRAELFLLTLSMKLCSTVRVTTPQTILYRTVKELYFSIESSGVLSIQVLQSGILIALYEMGHALYPAAFLSMANCARYSAALGIGKVVDDTYVGELPWHEKEEHRRVWWAIVILDRFINLCDPGRQLVTQNPDSSTYLPVDDAAWDAGTSSPDDAFTIGSSAGFHLGRFARFAQVAYLLTQALEQAAAEEPSTNAQLQRTIAALVNLSEVEGRLRRWVFCTQMAVCYSAILFLESRQRSVGDGHANLTGIAIGPLSTEASTALQAAFELISYFFVESNGPPCDRASPFLPHFLYATGQVYLRIAQAGQGGPSAVSDKLRVLKHALHGLNNRWLVAGVYLSLLERKEVLIQINDGATE